MTTKAEVEAAEAAFYGVHERGFIMRPLIPDENGLYDMEKALTAAHQVRALGSKEGEGELVEQYRAALEKISAIRDSIIGFQNVGWSEHIYPLVAALHEAGFDGIGYDKARENVSTLLDITKAANARADAAERRLAEALEALRGLLRGEYESAEPGLCDCVDNHGKPYQSQFLADRIAKAEAVLAPEARSHLNGGSNGR